jgi:hypothetical protein
MIYRFLFKVFILLSITLLITSRCTTEKTCNEYMDCNVKLHFYTVYKTGERIYVKDSVLKTIKFYADNFIDTAANSSDIKVPLSPHTDSVAFIVKINSLPTDVVYFKYTRNNVFVNYECGFRTEFHIDTLVSTQGRFDSIKIVQPDVTTIDEEHIKIYYNR